MHLAREHHLGDECIAGFWWFCRPMIIEISAAPLIITRAFQADYPYYSKFVETGSWLGLATNAMLLPHRSCRMPLPRQATLTSSRQRTLFHWENFLALNPKSQARKTDILGLWITGAGGGASIRTFSFACGLGA